MLDRLDALAHIHYGKSPNETASIDGSIPVVGTGGVYGWAKRSMFENGIVVARKGSLGKPHLFKTPFWPSDTTYAVIPRMGVEIDWLFYCLLNFDLTKLNEATGVPSINRNWLSKTKFENNGHVSQKKIGIILACIDRVIEKTEALIAKYQQVKAGLMHDLFTRGVLPNSQLRPPREQAPELYQETAIGWIPKEWQVGRAGDLCSLITKGTTPSNSDMWEGGDGVRFLRVDNLTFNGQLDFEASSFRISEQTHLVLLARSVCAVGDVLMNIVGPPLGKVALVTSDDGKININQAIAIFRPKAELSSIFLLQWLISDTAKRWILRRAKQTSGQLNVTLAMCQDLLIPLLSLEEQSRIEERFRGIDFLLQSESNRRAKLYNQRLGLMQDLLTGKVPVTVDTPEKVHA